MISHAVTAGRTGGQAASSSDYVPSGQPTFRPAVHYHPQFNGYGLAGASQATTVQTLQTNFQPPNNVVNNIANNNHSLGPNAMANHWYQPPQPAYAYSAPSNSREMRNKAEKQRRDRLNSFITELSTLVPLVSRSAKRLDKTSILRLTATHLRIYQTLVKGKGQQQMDLPPYVDQFLLEQLICDEMGGFLLILSPSGKIIFVSHTVETLLGHLQTDLMGQSLFTVTASEDHDRLRIFLGCEGEMEQDWRKYFNIRIRKAGPRSEAPQYESVRMMGVHRNLNTEAAASTSTAPSGNSSPMSSAASTSSLQMTLNTDILVFFVKLCRPQPLMDRLVAASKDEYVTRHLIDGRIIGCDQRISLIAGYMIEEIQGHSAFQYMHREDVRFVMIALRQMYDRGESRGNSCYRLKSRNGQFIYLKTFGFLEIDDKGVVESFICVNVNVDEKEGKHHINEMKRRYSAMFTSSLASLPYSESEDDSSSANPWISPAICSVPANKVDRTEDPQAIEMAVNELMQNLPSPGSDETPEEKPVVLPVHTNGSSTSTSESAPIKHLAPSPGKVLPESSATKPVLRIKQGGKRAPSTSPDHVKRMRQSSVDSEPPLLSPCINPSPMGYSSCPPKKMPKLEEQYVTPTDSTIHQQQHHHGA